MKRLDMFTAFQSLAAPSTKEDIIIEVAKQKNIRFNELPVLQKEVDLALDESVRLGFVDHQSNYYKLKVATPRMIKDPTLVSGLMNGQGDGKSDCCVCYPFDPKNGLYRAPRSSHNVTKQMLSDEISLCSECGLPSGTLPSMENQEEDNCKWSIVKDMEDCE